ncbi:MAG: hypothetical protein SFZ23_02880 [Planctomycetota bacterium]|nr:hypothetical protein [Planctomycetota bacterium]
MTTTPDANHEGDQPAPMVSGLHLAALALGELPEADRATVERAIEDRESTQRELALIRATLVALESRDLEEPPTELVRWATRLVGGWSVRAAEVSGDEVSAWYRRVGAVLAQLVFDSQSGAALAGFRGSGTSGDSRHLTLVSEAVEIDLNIARGAGLVRRVRGQVALQHLEQEVEQDAARLASARIAFVQNPGRVVETVCDDAGMFAMEIGPGTWEVRVECEGVAIGSPQIRID